MKQPLYIRSATAISPQNTFFPEKFLHPLVSTDTGKLYALEPPYADYISPVAIRRMSRIMKLTISTAMQSLSEAGITTPDAIITGTGRGAVRDMECFVKDMIRLEEGTLNPTTFIQSTYNSPNGWIAMQSACTGYNQTYVHRGCSLELALQDAQMMMKESDIPTHILVGCYDELTEEYHFIREKRNYWKKEKFNNAKLFDHSDTYGTIAGEGSAFFVFSNHADKAEFAITDLEIVYNTDADGLSESIVRILSSNGLKTTDISLVISGFNGDARQINLYQDAISLFPPQIPVTCFKHFSGEYDTAIGFGIWLAIHFIKNRYIICNALKINAMPIFENVLLINHYIFGPSSAILIKRL